MTSRGFPLILALLMAYGLLAAECSRYRQQRGNDEDEERDLARHRHRHRHEPSAITRRTNINHHRHNHDHRDRGLLPASDREGEEPESPSSWSRDANYEDEESLSEREEDPFKEEEGVQEEEEEDDDDEEDEDYEISRSYKEKWYPRGSRWTDHRDQHRRGYESRHRSPRYHHRSGHHATGWSYNEENERRAPSRYSLGRIHRGFRASSAPRRETHSGLADDYEDDPYLGEEDEDEDAVDYERSRGKYQRNPEKPWWRSSKKHRNSWRREWKSRHYDRYDRKLTGSKRNHLYEEDDLEDRRSASKKSRFDERRRQSNLSEPSKVILSKNPPRRKAHEDNEEYENHFEDDRLIDQQREKDDPEEEDIWKDAESEENEDENDEDELDNDFYKSETRNPPLKTYDDIIRRLTSDDPPSTSRPTIKRDYRNIQSVKYSKHDGLGSFRYDPVRSNASVSPFGHDHRAKINAPGPPFVATTVGYLGSAPRAAATSLREDHRKVSRIIDAGSAAKANERKHQEERKEARNEQAKTKSLEQQDYDDYLNAGDNEKEEDLIKAGVEDDTEMQADVNNADYTDDEGTVEDETPAERVPTTPSTTTTRTTTTTTTSTTTTTTTPRPMLVTQHFDYRESRAYEGGSGPQYNGYQSKNDYPPMSAHSVHKWQSLGTREGVKETRGNMQQYNKNGKSAEIREALQHAIKVSREGSCQWPRERIIPVREVYPSPSTTYIPHCAILHRCSDDTGCCRSEALTCVPKHSHRVELSFYTTSVGGASVVEKLSFYNHTECECRERTESETTNEKATEQRSHRHYQPQSAPQPQNMRRPPPQRKPCRCPSEFSPRITPDGECQCNCHEHDLNCIKTKRGKVYFSLADRGCIQKDECALPNCEFGDYMRRQGKCPQKKDRFNALVNYRTSMSHRYIRS